MKTGILIFSMMALITVGCRTNNNGSMEPRSTGEYSYPHSEPYSKEQHETVEEPAGANSQSREGQENPFVQPRAGETQQVRPTRVPPPQRR